MKKTTDSSRVHLMSFKALGTHCEVHYVSTACGKAPGFEQDVLSWITTFEARYSRFKADSLVSGVNLAAGGDWVRVDQEMEQMLDLCGAVYGMSSGILDPTVGPLLRLWDYRRKRVELPSRGELAEAMQLIGWTKVQREPGRVRLPLKGMSLDFGGFGKEWAVDAVLEIARAHKLDAALVDFGHDIRGFGAPPGRPAWHIGLEDPENPGKHKGSIALYSGKAIASSGDYLRGFTHGGRRYGHIIDPRNGQPVSNGCIQATAIADSCLLAGLLTSTAFVLGLEAGLEFYRRFPGAEGIILGNAARAQSRGFASYVVL